MTPTNEILDTKIIKFIQQHHVMNLSVCSHDQPYIAHCFYAYSDELNCFIFTSDAETYHVREMMKNPQVAAGIALETKVIGKIQGLQITGVVCKVDETDAKYKNIYLQKFPFAVLMKTHLWTLFPNYIKLTDNRLGFGKKLIWTKNKQ